ncbi:hypothetical protein [Paenibacillus elgii]|uniref:hypothetical protein n=1 Tax=Paenibacillus elgii TaxID=189691 RepID=UPI00203A8DD7|nr:hypothetical protein [Paenibacillus elgii]MCM3274283.1 hypothetical protein [Paenibacillus elgii]
MEDFNYDEIRELEINLLKEYGIPTLTNDYVGKTILYKHQSFFVFTDNTCFYSDDSLGMICDHDDISLHSYLKLWEDKFPKEIRLREKWFDRQDLVDLINGLPKETDFSKLCIQIKELLETK